MGKIAERLVMLYGIMGVSGEKYGRNFNNCFKRDWQHHTDEHTHVKELTCARVNAQHTQACAIILYIQALFLLALFVWQNGK